MDKHFLIGMDVGSTTVEAVVIDAATDEILWQTTSARHQTAEKSRVPEAFETEVEGFAAERSRHVHHGVGRQRDGQVPGREVRAGVNAVVARCRAHVSEMRLRDRAGWAGRQRSSSSRRSRPAGKKKIPSMNDKCAAARRGYRQDQRKLRFRRSSSARWATRGEAAPVAGSAAFSRDRYQRAAEDGRAADELMASLFEAIVMQTCRCSRAATRCCPVVLLLGGPNCYIKGMRDC